MNCSAVSISFGFCPLIGLSLLAAGAVRVAMPVRASGESRAGLSVEPTFQVMMMAIAVGLIAFEQFARTLPALHGGISDFDSLTYHLPTAARWVQTASLTSLHQIYPGLLEAYYPYNSELIHAVGMLAFGRDLLSPVLNLSFMSLLLWGAWTVGIVRGAGSSSVVAVAAVLTTLHFSLLGGGTALSDLPAVAFVLVMIALLAHGSSTPGQLFIAALAGGAAVGAKPDTGLMVLMLAAAAILAARTADRSRAAATCLLGLLLGGGYWYVRDLTWTGDPLPGLRLGVLPSPSAFPWPATFASAVANGRASLSSLAGGLDAALGPTWPAIFVLAVGGLALGAWRGRSAWERGAGVGGFLNLAVWPFSPFTETVFFNVRYVAPALLAGLVLLVATPRFAGKRTQQMLVLVLIAIAFVNVAHLQPTALPYRYTATVGAIVVLTALGAAARYHVFRFSALLLGSAAVIAGAAFGWPVTRRYLADRFSLGHFAYSEGRNATAVRNVFAWAQPLHRRRIGLEGGEIQYPLYGADLSNYVQYLGQTESNGGFTRIESCRGWRRAINQGRYDFVMTVPWGSESNSRPMVSPQTAWTRADPAATTILHPGAGVTVFAITGMMHPSLC